MSIIFITIIFLVFGGIYTCAPDSTRDGGTFKDAGHGDGGDGDAGDEDGGCLPNCIGKKCGEDNGCGLVCGECPKTEMLEVPAGIFWMGCKPSDPDCTYNGNEKPYHPVNVQAFMIDKYEVIAGDFKKCVDALACSYPGTDKGCNYNKTGMENHPINCVNWTQANMYCDWTKRRLPSEAEWEKAARGLDGGIFPWTGSTLSCDFAVMNDADAGGSGCGAGGTMVVGSRPDGGSPYGLMDMIGNVYEWVEDDWHDSYKGAPDGGGAWLVDGGSDFGILRGGSWGIGVKSMMRTSSRFLQEFSNKTPDFGFRCAATPE